MKLGHLRPGPLGKILEGPNDFARLHVQGKRFGESTTELEGELCKMVNGYTELVELLETITNHASERYPHFESERGQAELRAARRLINEAVR